MPKFIDALRSRLASMQRRLAPPRPADVPLQTAPEPAASDDGDTARFEEARRLHQLGQLDQAESMFRALLQKYPADFDLLHLLGVVQGQRGNFEAAIALIEQALRTAPDNAAAYSSLGNCFKGLNQHERALASYERALALRPDDADALNNRGATLRDLKRTEDALASFDRALALRPAHTTALENRGACLIDLARTAEALDTYERLLAAAPDHTEALIICGTLLHKSNRPEAALARFDRARQLRPDDAAVHMGYAMALMAQGRHHEALASYERALTLKPGDFGALYYRGTALQALNRHQDALACFDSALAIRPDSVDTLVNRGAALMDIKRYDDALQAFDRIVAIESNHAVAHHNRAMVLTALKQHQAALASFDRALTLMPDNIGTILHRGLALRELGRHEAALQAFDDVLAREPNHIIANLCRGVTLEDLRYYEDALRCTDRVLELQPDNVDAHNNRGTVLSKLRRHDEARASYDTALRIDPDHQAALFNRADLLVYARDGEAAVRDFERLADVAPDSPYVQGHLLRAKMSCCDWQVLDALMRRAAAGVRDGKRTVEPFQGIGAFTSPELLKRCAEIYSADKFPPPGVAPLPFKRKPGNKIRLGYVAGEFRHHATSVLMAELFERHDTGRFDVFAFDNGWDDGSPMRKRLEKAFTEIVDISRLSDTEAAGEIRQRSIDILIDLNGHVGRKRTGIFRLRAAPVQVNWLGFPGTMGTDFMDYVIGDHVLTPQMHDDFYAEKVVRLPDSYQVNDARRSIADTGITRSRAGLPQSGFVFCSFNDSYKITPEVFEVWIRLLKKVEHSVLWLFEGSTVAARNLRAEALARGVAPQRLVFAPRMDLPDHLARHRLADLFLDTIPCNAHTTASDALWAGLPLLTCLGSTFAGRVAASLLHAIGLPELVTRNLADYESLALELATTPVLLSTLRMRLAQNRDTHPLFDADRFRRHIESAYVTMHELSMRAEVPTSFSVEAVS